MIGLNVLLVALLIIATAIFVGAEFSFLRVRSSRIEQLIAEGSKNALVLQKITSNLDSYLSACQLGITVTALGLGFLGEPTVARILEPLFLNWDLSEGTSHSISIAIAFVTVTFLHVVLGELAPKTIAIQKAEMLSLLLAKPMRFFYVIMYPFIWVLNGSANHIVSLLGFKAVRENSDIHSEQELRILLSESYENGEINQAEYKYVNRIFDFDELSAREIMSPRIELVALDINSTIEENIAIMKEEQYTRFPICDGDKDHIIGFIHSKEFFMGLTENKDLNIHDLIRPMMVVPESVPVKELLRRFQKEAIHFAMLTDEYGGTSGLVTLEDILEEIVGDIRDEFDEAEKPDVEKITDNEYIFDNKVLINEVNDLFGTNLSNEDADTIGGYLYILNQDLNENDEVNFDNIIWTIMETDEKRYKRIKLKMEKQTDESTNELPPDVNILSN